MNTELLPRYSRVKRMITERIDSGEWQPRHRIPSESELVRDIGVSRMTINRALRELTLDGRLIRVQGVGTFVAEPKPISALFEVRNIADEIASRGHRHTAQVLTLRKEKASADIARSLGLKTGDAVFHSVLVHSEDDMPVQIEDRYVSPTSAPEYLGQDFSTQTPYVYLMAAAP
ncbi:MAG TPA: UTRA domain-containing protein, partial [Dongiaceae bacterium]|nr:UTRA domain-containing protein [Dongiaceae bacterium]